MPKDARIDFALASGRGPTRERDILEHAVHAVAEQVRKANNQSET